MKKIHPITWLIFAFVLVSCICLFLGMHYVNKLLPFAGIIGTLVGTIVGFALSRHFVVVDKREAYIINAQNVLLVLAKQLNEFANIKAHFSEYKSRADRHVSLPPFIISKTEWRISKEEIIKLNRNDKEIINIVYNFMHIDKSFNDLLLAIGDYNKVKKPFGVKYGEYNSLVGSTPSEKEIKELRKLSDAIYRRLDKIDYQGSIDSLHAYLTAKFPGCVFPKGEVEVKSNH